jgi:site-specific DNA-methyltransferase (adenine-specific)
MPLRSHEIICVFYKKIPIYNPQKEVGKPYKMTRRSDTNNYGEVKNLHQETNNETGLRFPKSVLKFSADKEKLHSTQKPLALMEWLIKTYTNEGDLVLDNCIGSGTTALAARNLHRDFIGIEKNEEIYNVALKRLGMV